MGWTAYGTLGLVGGFLPRLAAGSSPELTTWLGHSAFHQLRQALVWTLFLCLLACLAFATNPTDNSFRSHLTELSFRRHLRELHRPSLPIDPDATTAANNDADDDDNNDDDDHHTSSSYPRSARNASNETGSSVVDRRGPRSGRPSHPSSPSSSSSLGTFRQTRSSQSKNPSATRQGPFAPFRFTNRVSIALRTPPYALRDHLLFSIVTVSPSTTSSPLALADRIGSHHPRKSTKPRWPDGGTDDSDTVLAGVWFIGAFGRWWFGGRVVTPSQTIPNQSNKKVDGSSKDGTTFGVVDLKALDGSEESVAAVLHNKALDLELPPPYSFSSPSPGGNGPAPNQPHALSRSGSTKRSANNRSRQPSLEDPSTSPSLSPSATSTERNEEGSHPFEHPSASSNNHSLIESSMVSASSNPNAPSALLTSSSFPSLASSTVVGGPAAATTITSSFSPSTTMSSSSPPPVAAGSTVFQSFTFPPHSIAPGSFPEISIPSVDPSVLSTNPALAEVHNALVLSQSTTTDLRAQLFQFSTQTQTAHSSLMANLEELRVRKRDEDVERLEVKARTKLLEDGKRQAEGLKREAEKKLRVIEGLKEAVLNRIRELEDRLANARDRMAAQREEIKASDELMNTKGSAIQKATSSKREELKKVESELAQLGSDVRELEIQTKQEEDAFETSKTEALTALEQAKRFANTFTSFPQPRSIENERFAQSAFPPQPPPPISTSSSFPSSYSPSSAQSVSTTSSAAAAAAIAPTTSSASSSSSSSPSIAVGQTVPYPSASANGRSSQTHTPHPSPPLSRIHSNKAPSAFYELPVQPLSLSLFDRRRQQQPTSTTIDPTSLSAGPPAAPSGTGHAAPSILSSTSGNSSTTLSILNPPHLHHTHPSSPNDPVPAYSSALNDVFGFEDFGPVAYSSRFNKPAYAQDHHLHNQDGSSNPPITHTHAHTHTQNLALPHDRERSTYAPFGRPVPTEESSEDESSSPLSLSASFSDLLPRGLFQSISTEGLLTPESESEAEIESREGYSYGGTHNRTGSLGRFFSDQPTRSGVSSVVPSPTSARGSVGNDDRQTPPGVPDDRRGSQSERKKSTEDSALPLSPQLAFPDERRSFLSDPSSAETPVVPSAETFALRRGSSDDDGGGGHPQDSDRYPPSSMQPFRRPSISPRISGTFSPTEPTQLGGPVTEGERADNKDKSGAESRESKARGQAGTLSRFPPRRWFPSSTAEASSGPTAGSVNGVPSSDQSFVESPRSSSNSTATLSTIPGSTADNGKLNPDARVFSLKTGLNKSHSSPVSVHQPPVLNRPSSDLSVNSAPFVPTISASNANVNSTTAAAAASASASVSVPGRMSSESLVHPAHPSSTGNPGDYAVSPGGGAGSRFFSSIRAFAPSAAEREALTRALRLNNGSSRSLESPSNGSNGGGGGGSGGGGGGSGSGSGGVGNNQNGPSGSNSTSGSGSGSVSGSGSGAGENSLPNSPTFYPQNGLNGRILSGPSGRLTATPFMTTPRSSQLDLSSSSVSGPGGNGEKVGAGANANGDAVSNANPNGGRTGGWRSDRPRLTDGPDEGTSRRKSFSRFFSLGSTFTRKPTEDNPPPSLPITSNSFFSIPSTQSQSHPQPPSQSHYLTHSNLAQSQLQPQLPEPDGGPIRSAQPLSELGTDYWAPNWKKN